MVVGELTERVGRIIECANEQTRDLDANERAMVALLVAKLMESTVELDIVHDLLHDMKNNGREG